MEPPFPGMDPYLEAPHIWPDVHSRLAFAICDQIQPLLSPRYAATIVPYATFESIDIAPTRVIAPDIGIIGREQAPPSVVSTAIAAAPLISTTTMDVPTRYARIEVRTIGDETLVTAIEILSPVNKRPGTDGWEAYERKRRDILRSDAHLLEIDLLRAGRRPHVNDPLPPMPYFIFLSRAEHRPRIEIWPIELYTPLPIVPIPLQTPDPSVPLDLNRALYRIYTSARYDLRVNYRVDPPAPALSEAENEWMQGMLRARGIGTIPQSQTPN